MPPAPEPTPAARGLAARDEIVTIIQTIIPSGAPTAAPAPAPAKKTPVGPIVGGLIGGVFAGLLAAALVWWWVRHKRKEEERRVRYYKRQHRKTLQKRSLHSASSSLTMVKPPSVEKGYDPSVAVSAPARSYAAPKEYDPFKTERGYGFETRSPVSPTEYSVQRGYEPVEELDHESIGMALSTSTPAPASPAARAKSPPAPMRVTSPPSRVTSPPSSTPQSPPSPPKGRGAQRAAVAEQAAAAASAPASTRHRPLRPSPLRSAEASPEGSPLPAQNPFGSDSDPSPSTSESSHAYAAAALGAWSVTDKQEKYQDGQGALGSPIDTRTPSGQYSYDPFAEYHEYMARGDEDKETLKSPKWV